MSQLQLQLLLFLMQLLGDCEGEGLLKNDLQRHRRVLLHGHDATTTPHRGQLHH